MPAVVVKKTAATSQKLRKPTSLLLAMIAPMITPRRTRILIRSHMSARRLVARMSRCRVFKPSCLRAMNRPLPRSRLDWR